ncbi:MAG: hypothetical protein WD556_02335 [Actinomycetota bacterium]
MPKHRRIVGALVSVALAAGLFVGLMPSAGAVNIGEEGCTPGYWKNHTDNWEEYTPGSKLGNQNWDIPASLSDLNGKTFEQALSFKGGTGLSGAAKVLFRAVVAAYLNAAHEGVGYPYRRFDEPGNLQTWIRDTLATKNRAAYLELAAELDAANNLGCPL